MLKRLRLRNFKGFVKADIPLRSITLLAGLNSSGKSSVIQALLLFKQIEFDTVDRKRIHLNLQGPYIRLGTGRDVLCEFAEEDELELTITSTTGGEGRFVFTYDATADRLHAPLANIGLGSFGFDDVHYLCAERIGPRVTYPLSKSDAEIGVGAAGELAYHYLLLHRDDRIVDERLAHPLAKSHGLLNQVQAWLGEVSPGVRLDIKPVAEADIAIPKFGFERTSDVSTGFFRPTNVGFGLSYTLPIITVLLSARPGSVVLLENPEAHLHPRGQSQLARLISLAAKRLQVVVETHSDHVMNSLRVAVREGELAPEEVQFLFFRRERGASVIDEFEVDANGRVSAWPEGFFDEYGLTLAKLVAPPRSNEK